MNSIAKRSHNNNQLSIIDNQLQRYKTFFHFFFCNTKSLFDFIYLKVALCPRWPKNLLNPCNLWLIISVLSCPSCTSCISWLKSARKMLQKCYKSKTNPKRTQTNPIFPRPNLILSPKSRIFGKFRTTFLYKTNPIYKNEQWSMIHQKTLNMQNEPNLNKILTYLTKEMKRTYSDFCQKDVKKTNPILTFS